MPVLLIIERPVTTTLRPLSTGGVADLLDAVDVARERRDDDALVGVVEDAAQRVRRPRPPERV